MRLYNLFVAILIINHNKLLFCCTILPGKTDLVRKFEKENSIHDKEHDEFYKSAGISREQSWVQSAPPGGSQGILDFEVVSMELEDPVRIFKEFATSSLHWAIKFGQYAKEAYGLDLESGFVTPINEIVVDCYEEKLIWYIFNYNLSNIINVFQISFK
jgi:hypothetical protein